MKAGLGETAYPVTSLYFDSMDLMAFFEKADGQHFRRKIRLRTYHREFSRDDASYLEIKRRLDSVVIKDRLKVPADTFTPSIPMSALLRRIFEHAEPEGPTENEAHMMAGWLNLQPTALVRYQRYALVGKEDPNTRVTVDRNLEGIWSPPALLGPLNYRAIDNVLAQGMDGIAGKYSILELKSNYMVPAWFHDIVCELELMRTAYSKYFLVVWALRPQLVEDFRPLSRRVELASTGTG